MIEYGIILAVVLVVFWRALLCGYVVDDVVRVPLWRSWREKKFARMSFTKLLFNACYGAGVFKTPMQEYAFTLCIHAANCCLIYKATGSLIPALLYCVNPVNNQTAVWLNGRRYALTVLAVLIAWNFHWVAPIAYAFAIFIHHSGAFAPLLFLFTPLAWIVPVLAPIGAFLGIRRIKKEVIARKEAFSPNNELQKIHLGKAIVYVKSVGYYFWHCILPFKPGMYHQFLYYYSRYDAANKQAYAINFDFIKGISVIGFLAYEALINHNVWAFWFGLFISNFCNIYTVTMNASDRYCSLANVGAMVLLSQYIGKLPAPYEAFVLAVFFTLYILKYQPLFNAYKTIEDFYLYHINLTPHSAEPRALLAARYMEQRDVMSAFAIIKKGLRYNSTDFKLQLIMAQIFLLLGQFDKGMKTLAIAEKNAPNGEHEIVKTEFDKIRKDFEPLMDAQPAPHVVAVSGKKAKAG